MGVMSNRALLVVKFLLFIAAACCFRLNRPPFSKQLKRTFKYAPDDQNIDTSAMKLGVLLLNLGGPETPEVLLYIRPNTQFNKQLLLSDQDVEGFLFNLFADPDIIRLPSFLQVFQKPIAYVIAKRRYSLL